MAVLVVCEGEEAPFSIRFTGSMTAGRDRGLYNAMTAKAHYRPYFIVEFPQTYGSLEYMRRPRALFFEKLQRETGGRRVKAGKSLNSVVYWALDGPNPFWKGPP
jgi:hypothetical protein